MNQKQKNSLGKWAKEFELEQSCIAAHQGGIELEKDVEDILHSQAAHFEDELISGFHAVAKYPKSVTFFGSTRLNEGNEHYESARSLAGKICKLGFAVITGGGPGIMEAANRGSYEACGSSVGFNIELPSEQTINPYVTDAVDFTFFSSRKMSMYLSAEAYAFYPGGYGTLDELFQLLTLIQTKKAPPTPVILAGSKYWNAVDGLIKKTLLDEFGTISAEDRGLYTITDDEEEMLAIIKNAPLRKDYNTEG